MLVLLMPMIFGKKNKLELQMKFMKKRKLFN